MPISIVGNGSITGLTAGGLPDGSVVDLDLATGISSSKLTGALPALDGSSLTGVGVDGIVSSANATAITIDSSENVGIKNTSPGSYDAGARHLVIGSPSEASLGLTIASSTNGTIYWADGTTGDEAYRGTISYNHASDYMLFRTGGFTERLRITSDGRGLSQFTAKSWINMNGQGTISIRDSHNVSSISDENSGYYTVSFANNLGNGNYSVVATANNGANTANTDCGASPGSTASYVIDTWESTNAVRSDFAIVCAVVFGD